MNKSRSKGVTFFGWYFIVTSIIGFIGTIYLLICPSQVLLDFYSQTYKLKPEIISRWLSIVAVPSNILLFFVGINILKLKELWRRIILYYCYFAVFHIIILGLFSSIKSIAGVIFSIAFSGFILYFFTHPEVKKQFISPQK